MNSKFKKSKYSFSKLYLLLILMILPFNVQALEGSLSLNCNKTKVSPGETISCTLNGTATGDSVSAVSAKITTSNSSLSLGEVVVNQTIWQGNGNNGEVELYTEANKTGTFEIAQFKLTATSNITIGEDVNLIIDNVSFCDSNFKTVPVNQLSYQIRIASKINTLSSLSIDAGTLNPTFNKNTTTYTATVNSTEVTITATATDSNATITGDIGKKSLNYGINTFKINVKSEANTTNVYTINITRPDNRDTNNYLKTLTINGDSISLLNDKTKYTYQVENDVVEAVVNASLSSSKATFKDGNATKTISLNEGDNRLIIEVIAENQQSRMYTIIINRKVKQQVSTDDSTDKDDLTDNNIPNKDNTPPLSEKVESVQTGDSDVYIVLMIAVISMLVVVYAYKYYKKKTKLKQSVKEEVKDEFIND